MVKKSGSTPSKYYQRVKMPSKNVNKLGGLWIGIMKKSFNFDRCFMNENLYFMIHPSGYLY